MPSNSEMFERGAQDAVHDELNSFYYQHYYFYRQGYDQARRQVRVGKRPPLAFLLALAVLMFAVGLGGWWLGAGGRAAPAEGSTPQPEVASLPPTTIVLPTARPPAVPLPRPAPPPPPTLAIEGQAVIINLNGAPLRARQNPGLTPIVARIAEGTTVTLREGPLEADGYTWWRVEAPSGVTGWVAERSPEGVAFLEPLP
jgi:hypothetical protein